MLSTTSQIERSEIDLFFEELNSFCEQQKSQNLVYFGYEEICNIAFAETYRSIIDFEFSNRYIRDLLISQMESLQSYSPSASTYFPFLLSTLRKHGSVPTNNSLAEKATAASVESIKEILVAHFTYSSLLQPADLIKLFEKNGFISNFEIKKSNSFQNACVFESGMSIHCNLHPAFFKSKQSINLSDTQVVIYDGFISEVSEINLILNLSMERGTNFLILSKGVHHDVANTCAVNLDLGKCKVCIAEPDPSFWNETITKVCDPLGLSTYGFVTGRLLNNYEINDDLDVSVLVNRSEIFLKSKSLDLTHSAKTSILLNESTWSKKGFLFDQLNFFSSMLQQIATCGVISNNDFLELSGIDVCKETGLEASQHPAFPVSRALKEAETVLNKILSIGYLVRLER